MSNFLLGGRTGDLIHALYVAKNTPGKHNLYITDRRELHSDGFHLPLEETYYELKPIIESQDYCNSFEIFHNQVAILEIGEAWAAIRETGTNLSGWRRYAYSACWTQLLANTFNVPANGEPWIKWKKKEQALSDIVLVHQSVQEARRGHHWDVVVSMYHSSMFFMGNDEEYKAFGRPGIFHYKPESLSDYFKAINSCKFFIGNQSAPLAIAHSLGVPRLAMLNEIDKIHYVGEEKFCKDFYWMAKDTSFFPALNFENVK